MSDYAEFENKMKKTYKAPEMQMTQFSSETITNVNLLSGVQTSFKLNSTKNIKGGNLIDF